ncbi:hypothetical protein ABW19_dt0210523 [Dactylella cylindrospora]|nr:hypothetical protein ABW19_dt0210523 [Dactylella cylindrospora]
MVSTRAHPGSFSTPSKSNGRPLISKPTATWSHKPSILFLLWLTVSLPLVVWDFGYVFLRPHSMPGGKYHLLWKPYAIYCEVDLIYGFKHFYDKKGFNPAQSTLNFFETLTYSYYFWLVASYGIGEGSVYSGKRLVGKKAAVAAVVGLSACVATFWKTVLYWLVEPLGSFENIGHNSLKNLILFWILPNGLWIIFPAIGIYTFGNEIIEGLTIASGGGASDEVAVKEE